MPDDDVTITRSGLVKAASLVGAVLAALAGAGGFAGFQFVQETKSARAKLIESHWTFKDAQRYAELLQEVFPDKEIPGALEVFWMTDEEFIE